MRSIGLFAAAAVVGGVMSGLLAGFLLANLWGLPAEASTASHLTVLTISGDSFWNYDFNSQRVSSTNVDWAMSMLFYNNAEIDKVKDFYHSGFPHGGGPMYARLDDGGGWWVWDGDGGIKSAACPSFGDPPALHLRLYADSDDRLYNTLWGYYVLGSTHMDKEECWTTRQFGWSEWIEGTFAAYARSHGWGTVYDDWLYWANWEPTHWEGNHYWDNDGMASTVYVP